MAHKQRPNKSTVKKRTQPARKVNQTQSQREGDEPLQSGSSPPHRQRNHPPDRVPSVVPPDQRRSQESSLSPIVSDGMVRSPPAVSGGSPARQSEQDSLTEAARAARRAEKSRRNRSDSIESAELKIAATKSLQDLKQPADNSDDGSEKNTWRDDKILKAAREALAREREAHESSIEYRRRHAASIRAEQAMRNVRVRGRRSSSSPKFG
ncbi:hypothetical protein R3P38DRAFT_2810646 [Favolaschia claudopus]|uniref:Uncharacterized protein n=1 Tax=Favolaschia claudopus TaxID=2862362 RepID=A0AAV9ZBN3_9AGAR